MNIVIVTPSYFPIRGGSEQTVFEWTQRIARSHEVSVITPNLAGAARYERTDEGVNIHRVNPAQIRLIGQFVRGFLILRLLLTMDRRRRIDVVHIGHIFETGLGPVVFKLLKKRPLVTTLLGWDTYDPISPLPRRWNRYLAFVMNTSDRVVAMSSHIAEAARLQGYRKHIELIPHGTDLFCRESTVSIRDKHGIEPSTRICLSLQRLHPRKGLQYLIEAAALVKKVRTDVVWIIGGTGPQQQALEQQAIAHDVTREVVFAGFIPDNELASYYEQSDVFVLPTLYEAFGLVYTDALAKGLPIITTAVGGALDIVNDTVGILVPPRDPAALAQAAVKALGTDWDKAAIKRHAAQYDWDSIVEKYLSIYEAVARAFQNP